MFNRGRRITPLLVLACLGLGGLLQRARAGEADGESLRAELQAMRQAYESRISALESEIKDLRTTGGQKREINQRIDETLAGKTGAPVAQRVLAPVPANAVTSVSRLNIGGYTEFTYISREDRIPSFDQLRTVAQLNAQINERLRFYAELEQEHGATIEGEPTGGELELEQAYLDFSFDKAINFRAGMVLVPIGRYNLYHEGFVNNLVDRPLVNLHVIPSTWFEEGVGLHGKPIDNGYLGLSYEAYAFNPARATEVNSAIGFHEIRNEGREPLYNRKAGAARVAIEPARGFKTFADYLELGLSGYISGFKGFQGENDAGDTLHLHGGNLRIGALDLTYEKWNFGLKGEMALSHVDSGGNDTAKGQTAFGYYVEGYYKFWPKFLTKSPFGRSFKDPKLVLATRYESVDLNRAQLDQRDLRRVVVGLGYRPLPSTVFKFDVEFDHSPSHLSGTTLEESGLDRNSRSYLFGISTGF
ncbi:MAG TPA: hypothetical protein VGP72_27800 [Planctomycetota bacterium]|jgi:hypothetical protein